MSRKTGGWIPLQDTVGWCSVHAVDHHSQPCTEGGPNRKGTMMVNIVTAIWKQLDDEVDEIIDIMTQRDRAIAALENAGQMGRSNHIDELEKALATAKGRARGKAEALALMMHPHFADADEISQESMVRKAHRDAGQQYQTRGVLRESKSPGWYHAADGVGFTAGLEVQLAQEREQAEARSRALDEG